jgi:hypothetical protein
MYRTTEASPQSALVAVKSLMVCPRSLSRSVSMTGTSKMQGREQVIFPV